MTPPDPAPEISSNEVFSVFEESDRPCAPLTATSVAEDLDCTPQTAEAKLTELTDRGELHSTGLDTGTRVWWYASWENSVNSTPSQASELEQFEAFTSAVEDSAIFTLDSDGRVSSWNEGASRIEGYPASEILGEHFSVFYTEDDIDRGVPEQNLETARAEGRIEDEGWRLREDGSRFWASVVITAVRDGEGTLQGFTKVTRDLTERKAYERQLEQQNSKLETELGEILGRVSDAVYALDAEWRYTLVNDQAEEQFGFTREELLGQSIWKMFPEAAETEVWDQFHASMATQEPVSFTVFYEPIEGWYEINAYPSETGLSIYFREVTERKERELELKRYETTVETVWDGITTLDSDDRFVMVNEAFCEMTGYARDEILGEHATTILDPTDYEEAGTLHEEVESGARDFATLKYELLTADGSSLPVEARFGPVEFEDGTTGGTGVIRDLSDRIEREHELEQYEQIVETVWDGVYALDDEDRFVLVNQAFCELVGYEREELLGQHPTLINSQAVNDAANELQAEVIAGERPVGTLEIEFETADGKTVPVETRLGPYEYSDGRYGRCGVSRDITERKERERALMESERRFRAVFEEAFDAILLADDAGNYREANPAAAELLGVEYTDLLDLSVAAILPDEYDFDASWESFRETGELRGTIPLVRPDGEERIAEFTAKADILPARHLSILRDVTDRVNYERELEISEHRYRALVENFPEGFVALFDEDLRYTTTGGQLLDEFYETVGDPSGDRILDRYPDDIVSQVEPHFRKALEGESNEFEVDYLGRHLRAYTLPIRTADEREGDVGMLVVQDITERRESRQKLVESNERLEQFAYAASHDLQEPLRMVTNYLGLIEERYADILDEGGREFIDFALDGAERMRKMIDALLDYSRIESQGKPFEPVDLNSVFEDVQRDLELRIEESTATITADPIPHVTGDRAQLHQLLQNLLRNAIEYCGDQPPRIHVSAERDGREWIVSVHDEGIGIDPADADRIFRLFQRLHTQEDHPGTGIGLALCERIIERHGGEIWVDSAPGEGATFAFTLPAVSDSDREDDA